MTATERIRKHRAKLRAEHCSRLDVWIGSWLVEGIRELARGRGQKYRMFLNNTSLLTGLRQVVRTKNPQHPR